MAASGVLTVNRWSANFDTMDPAIVLKRAVDGDPSCVHRVMREPDFIHTGRMDVSGETFVPLDLTALGVTFAAGTQRVVEVELFCSGATVATESGYIHRREMIVGGATPTLGIVIGAIDTNMAGAVGGFTASDILLDFILATANVTIRLTNEGATEINNYVLKVYVGRAQPIPLGV